MSVDRRTLLAGALSGLIAPALALRVRAHDRLHEVAIRDFAFDPAVLTVHPTDRVRFTNHDFAPHTATAADGSWDTGELGQGDSITLTVSETWASDYVCAFHPAMTASLVIESHP